ncbi:HNH endonuclease [Oceanibaculum indicum]|uniref:HNH endonuclease n=1 Tax=Oceanibaculum indicum TaxID=526216 RepID=UPI000EAF1E3E|nr:HNH endonuclease [Oceanibaculum indicum]
MAISFIKPRLNTLDTNIARPAPKKADAFYLSPEWRALVAQVIKERGRRCEDPACRTPHGPWGRIFGDHIHEIIDGGARLDPTNVMLRCSSCHAVKTAAEARRRRLGTSIR